MEKLRLSNMYHPLTDIQADFEINRPTIDIKLPRKINIGTDGQTDRQTARRIDGRTVVAYDNNR